MKILISGSITGPITTYIKKLTSINNKNGPFDLLLLTGSFEFDSKDFEGVNFPIPTYFITCSHVIPKERYNEESGSIANNLYFLGSKGIFTTLEGLKIAFVSGIEQGQSTTQGVEQVGIDTPFYNKSIIDLFIQQTLDSDSYKGVDILLTFEWPHGIGYESASALEKKLDSKIYSESTSRLASVLKPRYHFACKEQVFFEREPFMNHDSNVITRFIGLGHFGHANKERWFYALNIDPMDSHVPAPTPLIQASACPYERITSNKKRSLEFNRFGQDLNEKKFKKGAPPASYVCKICNTPGHWIKECPQKTSRPSLPEGYVCKICQSSGHFIRDCPQSTKSAKNLIQKRNSDQCWFCLSNPEIEKHLLVSIGEETYIALAKGGLVDWGGHLLIVPIAHHESTRHLQHSSIECQAIIDEIESTKKQLYKMYKERGEAMVCFEMYGGDIGHGTPLQHMHIQVIPIPIENEEEIFNAFEREASSFGLEVYSKTKSLPDSLTMPYCQVHVPSLNVYLTFVPNADKMKEYRMLEDQFSSRGKRPPRMIDLRFGRSVVSQLLGAPEKVDWKNCVQSMDEEKEMTKYIKSLMY